MTLFLTASILQDFGNTEQSTISKWKNGTMSCDLVFVASCEKGDPCVYQLLARQSLKGGLHRGRRTPGQGPLDHLLWIPSATSPSSSWGKGP